MLYLCGLFYKIWLFKIWFCRFICQKSWGEIWEIKPDKNKYYLSGPKQLQKYLDALSNTKAGRNLGNFKTYYFSTLFYEVTIRSNSNDGMIYYSYKTNEKINGAMLLAVTSFILIATGVGSPAGVAGMSGVSMMLVA